MRGVDTSLLAVGVSLEANMSAIEDEYCQCPEWDATINLALLWEIKILHLKKRKLLVYSTLAIF